MTVLLRGRWILCRSVDSQTLKLSTVAGSGAKGYKGDGGPVVLAKLDDPSGLAIDRDGNLYFSEYVNHRIRHVDAKSNLYDCWKRTTAPNGNYDVAVAGTLIARNPRLRGFELCLCPASEIPREDLLSLQQLLPHLGLEWHGQEHAGILQSPCRTCHVASSLQKDEIIGGQTPIG